MELEQLFKDEYDLATRLNGVEVSEYGAEDEVVEPAANTIMPLEETIRKR